MHEWEVCNPGYTFEHVFYTERSREVRKITGTVPVLKRELINGVKRNVSAHRRVRWDGFGRCYSINSNSRLRQYDITFPN